MPLSVPSAAGKLKGAAIVLAAGLALSVSLAGCNAKPAAEAPIKPAAILTGEDARDIHSFARPLEARVTHVDLDLRVDFAAKRLAGKATLDIDAKPDATAIVLDTQGLEISSITDADGKPLTYALGAADPNMGQPLTVTLPQGVRKIVVNYRTGPEAGALQWLTPEQTAGKKHPFLFSQGQSILTRSWVPTQDSPAVRQTYSARVVVPEGLKAVMSAEMLTPDGEKADGGRAFRFKLDKPVPPYLMAIAVGDLAFKELGPRSGVYAEPATVEKAAAEFVNLEKMIDAAEKLYGPYRWGRYDLLVLPPAFPFGGMENPRLTFLTPTILAGDRSLVSLVAHELAHSWSGNLVTNATWADFWLNEGFTVYFENRIMESLYGPERATMERALGWRDMQDTITELGGPTAPDTRLHIDLKGRNPDDGLTEIAYEKGAFFLRAIEAAVGREKWDAYLRSYFDRHAFQPITTSLFLADLRANLIKGDAELERKINIDGWVYQPGVPAGFTAPTTPAFDRVDAQAKAFASGTPAAQLQTANWTTQEWQRFLGALPAQMTDAQLADLDNAFKLSGRGNSEVLFAWLMIGVKNRYEPIVQPLEAFLMGNGRRKFILPLFTALMAQGDWGQPIARRIYAKARPGYHPVTSGSVDEVVK